jgi:hypothetical protein
MLGARTGAELTACIVCVITPETRPRLNGYDCLQTQSVYGGTDVLAPREERHIRRKSERKPLTIRSGKDRMALDHELARHASRRRGATMSVTRTTDHLS